MSRQKKILFALVLVLIGGTAGLLGWLKTHQRLGEPAIIGDPVAGSMVINIKLPERVLDCTSEILPPGAMVTNMLPKDTSLAGRLYESEADNFWFTTQVVLMGLDRTSIHKPDYCLPGQGWTIGAKSEETIRIEGPEPYTLTVAKWKLSNPLHEQDPTKGPPRGLYVFWFVADGETTIGHWQRIWWLSRDLLFTGVLQRWAYVSYFTGCQPGQEDLVFERLKKAIAASVPEFQKPPVKSARSVAVNSSSTEKTSP